MTTRAYSYGAKAPTENAELVRQQLILAHRYANRLVEIERERREAGLKADEDEQALEACEAKAAEAIRRARADSGLYWGTYLCVEDAAQRSRRTSREAPRFRRWDGSGLLATQLQGGLAVPDLLAGTDRRAQLVGEGKRRLLRLRVGSTGRDPVWAAFPMVYHRDLPPEGTVKWARICCHRLGTHTKWSAQIVLDGLPEVTLPTPTRGTVAIDVGWRRFDEGVRVATWVDDEGETGELLMPHELVERWHKVEDLRSIRDTNFNHARDELREWRSLETLPDSKALPDWLRETTKALHAWRAPARLAALALRWRSQRFEGDETGFEPLEAWRAHDRHLLEWEANQRENVLRSRRERYRLFARKMATYRQIVVEKLDLRDFAELPPKPRLRASRGRRFAASLSELLACLADAAGRAGSEWIEAPSAYTTHTCSACGSLEKFDAAVEVEHSCGECGQRWDQDENAARNLLQAARCGEIKGGRSRQQRVEKKGESKADARRAKGLATRRARRSKVKDETPEMTEEK